MTPTLIYCAKKNYFAPIAVAYGFEYGAQLPYSVYMPPYFADQNPNKPPPRKKYIAALAHHRPQLATVLDLEYPLQLPEVLTWASEAAPHVTEAVIIIPKWPGIIADLPRSIGGRPVWLGYSVETSHGSTDVSLAEFRGWPVHLLGGNPLKQMELAQHPDLDVRSVDCNYIQKSAVKWNQFLEWTPTKKTRKPTLPPTRWRQLKEIGYSGHDAPYEAFKRSCDTLIKTWAFIYQQ